MFASFELEKRIAESGALLPGRFDVSGPLADALLLARQSLPAGQDVISEADLILAISDGKGRAVRTLNLTAATAASDIVKLREALKSQADSTPSQRQCVGELVVGEERVRIDKSVQALLAFAQIYSLSQSTSTKDIVLGESAMPGSSLTKALAELGAASPKETLKNLVQEDFLPEGKPLSVIFTPTNNAARVNNVASETSSQTSQEKSTNSIGEDILAQTKESKETLSAAIWPDQEVEILRAIAEKPITVLVSQTRFQADVVVRELAEVIASDQSQMFTYKSLVSANINAFFENPNEFFPQLMRTSTKGIVYFPDLSQNRQLLSDSNASIQRQIIKNGPKYLVALNEKDWRLVANSPAGSKARAVYLPAPTVDQLKTAITNEKKNLEAKLGLVIADSAVSELARLSARYACDPLELLDIAAQGIKFSNSPALKSRLKIQYEADNQIDARDVDLAIKTLRGIVVSPDDKEKYVHMEEALSKEIIGQDAALKAVSDAVRQEKSRLKEANKPIGAFIFLGPTGVGKTETAKALARFLFDDEKALIELDMSEYQEKHTLSRLIGAPPGYVGYEEGGQLTEVVKQKPYSVVVWDEFEKAHPDILKIGLQINEEARATDGMGNKVDFSNVVIIYTGNVDPEELKSIVRPEFLNRIDAVVIFQPLSKESLARIAEIHLQKLAKKLSEQEIGISFSDEAKGWLVEHSFNPEFGARPLLREIKERLNAPLSLQILGGQIGNGDKVEVSVYGGQVVTRKASNPIV